MPNPNNVLRANRAKVAHASLAATSTQKRKSAGAESCRPVPRHDVAAAAGHVSVGPVQSSLEAVFRALAFVAVSECSEMSLADMVTHSGVTRWQLEHAFRRHVGRSPQQEIRRVRLERILRELERTNDVLPVVAEKTGFKHVEYLSVFFKRATGESPGAYRRRFRAASRIYPQAAERTA